METGSLPISMLNEIRTCMITYWAKI